MRRNTYEIRRRMYLGNKMEDVCIKHTNNKMKFYEMIDQMIHDFGADSLLKDEGGARTAIFQYSERIYHE